jgi:hypothetical protein
MSQKSSSSSLDLTTPPNIFSPLIAEPYELVESERQKMDIQEVRESMEKDKTLYEPEPD